VIINAFAPGKCCYTVASLNPVSGFMVRGKKAIALAKFFAVKTVRKSSYLEENR